MQRLTFGKCTGRAVYHQLRFQVISSSILQNIIRAKPIHHDLPKHAECPIQSNPRSTIYHQLRFRTHALTTKKMLSAVKDAFKQRSILSKSFPPLKQFQVGRRTPFSLQSFLIVEVIFQSYKVRNTEWGCEPEYIKDRLQGREGRSHNSKER